MIKAGANVNAADNDGWTPLIHGAYEGHEYVLTFALGLLSVALVLLRAVHCCSIPNLNSLPWS